MVIIYTLKEAPILYSWQVQDSLEQKAETFCTLSNMEEP